VKKQFKITYMKTKRSLIGILVLLVAIIMMPSCRTGLTVTSTTTAANGSVNTSNNSKEVKQRDFDFYKSKLTRKEVKECFNLAADILRAEQALNSEDPNIDSALVKTSYDQFYAIVKDYMIREHKRYLRKMDWKNEFVKVRYIPWDEMPKASDEFAKQFNDFNNEALKELRKIKLGGTSAVNYQKIYHDKFMFKFIDAAVVKFVEEFAEKSADPTIKFKKLFGKK
jgi:hypothetical protein